MFHSTDDERIAGYRPLISPAILMEELPLSETASNTVAQARSAAEAIVRGDDDRLLVVFVGSISTAATGLGCSLNRMMVGEDCGCV